MSKIVKDIKRPAALLVFICVSLIILITIVSVIKQTKQTNSTPVQEPIEILVPSKDDAFDFNTDFGLDYAKFKGYKVPLFDDEGIQRDDGVKDSPVANMVETNGFSQYVPLYGGELFQYANYVLEYGQGSLEGISNMDALEDTEGVSIDGIWYSYYDKRVVEINSNEYLYIEAQSNEDIGLTILGYFKGCEKNKVILYTCAVNYLRPDYLENLKYARDMLRVSIQSIAIVSEETKEQRVGDVKLVDGIPQYGCGTQVVECQLPDCPSDIFIPSVAHIISDDGWIKLFDNYDFYIGGVPYDEAFEDPDTFEFDVTNRVHLGLAQLDQRYANKTFEPDSIIERKINGTKTEVVTGFVGEDKVYSYHFKDSNSTTSMSIFLGIIYSYEKNYDKGKEALMIQTLEMMIETKQKAHSLGVFYSPHLVD